MANYRSLIQKPLHLAILGRALVVAPVEIVEIEMRFCAAQAWKMPKQQRADLWLFAGLRLKIKFVLALARKMVKCQSPDFSLSQTNFNLQQNNFRFSE